MAKQKTTIRALREFSHYHLGTVDGGQVKAVPDDIAEALIGMGLAERVEVADGQAQPEPQPEPAAPKATSRKGAK